MSLTWLKDKYFLPVYIFLRAFLLSYFKIKYQVYVKAYLWTMEDYGQ